jgi:hypothetical protein
MIFAMLSAIGITALLFLWVYQFCRMVLGWISTQTP